MNEDKWIQEKNEVENKSIALNARYKKSSKFYYDHYNKKEYIDEYYFKKSDNIHYEFCDRVDHNENIYHIRIYHDQKKFNIKKNDNDDEFIEKIVIYNAR